METLFNWEAQPEAQPEAKVQPETKVRRCRNCKHIASLNEYSNRYWYCMVTPSRRTSYGVKAVKRMDKACYKFQENK
jgi:hypothetical protein